MHSSSSTSVNISISLGLSIFVIRFVDGSDACELKLTSVINKYCEKRINGVEEAKVTEPTVWCNLPYLFCDCQ